MTRSPRPCGAPMDHAAALVQQPTVVQSDGAGSAVVPASDRWSRSSSWRWPSSAASRSSVADTAVGRRAGGAALRRRDGRRRHRPPVRRRLRVLRRRGRGRVRLRRRRTPRPVLRRRQRTRRAVPQRQPGRRRAARSRARASAVTDLTAVTGAYPLDVDSDGLVDLAVLRVGEDVILRGRGDCRVRAGQRAARHRRGRLVDGRVQRDVGGLERPADAGVRRLPRRRTGRRVRTAGCSGPPPTTATRRRSR